MENKKNGRPLETIKFRCKRADNGEWVVGSLVNNGAIHVDEYRRGMIYISSDGRYACGILSETFGLFTGLNDKNGKEIWEGDIIQGENGHEYHIQYLQFTSTEGLFMAKCIKGHSYGCKMRALSTIVDVGIEYSVIGNIHDNPELCK